MISDEHLLELNQQGFIPGPIESEEEFLQRVEFTKKLSKSPKKFFEEENSEPPFAIDDKVLKPRWNWTRAQLHYLFDMAPFDLAMFYTDEKLTFFQGAATWILAFGKNNIRLPLIQFRKKLKNASYLGFYTLDDILAHEAVHAARVAFDEPKTEELFAYMSSSSSLRRILGPLIRSPLEVFIFFSAFGLCFLSELFFLFSENAIFSYLFLFFFFSSLFLLSFGLARLFLVRYKVSLTYRKLKKLLKDKKKARSVLFRLTDDEIEKFASTYPEQIADFIESQKEMNLRLRLIYLAYLK
ncbi:MAG: hypothetical protein HZB76_04270 [Chlamydiae bacterium]|nr:hypothetical protein [Chlamydiota bacterium]